MGWTDVCIVCDNGKARSKGYCMDLSKLVKQTGWKVNFDYGGIMPSRHFPEQGREIAPRHYARAYFAPVDPAVARMLADEYNIPPERMLTRSVNSVEDITRALCEKGIIP